MIFFSSKSLITISLLPFFLIANPTGHKIISGDVAITSLNNNECIIHQNSNKAVVDWESFSIQENEVTKFIQPSSSSAILNRVIGNDMSQIYGSLQSNGQVYLINPNGWVIGPKGFIDTQGFIASTLDLKNEEFLSQDIWHFSGLSNAKIINNGKIIAQNNHVLLIANEIENNGSISAKNGNVDLMAGYDVILVPSSENKVSVGLKKEGQITNKGFIESVETKLQASGGNAYSLAINHEGVIDAIGIEYKDGKAILISDATTSTNGKILAKNANETGGKIQILGQNVRLEKSSDINASGKNGGGEILVGGDYQGKNPDIQNAQTVYVDKEANIKADALENGNGGKVIVWGNERNDYFGHTSVGAQNGDGGLIEVSSPLGLNYRGTINAISLNGKVGTLLLDPTDINITNTSPSSPAFANPYTPATSPANLFVDDLTGALAGASVIINTSGAGGSIHGNITVANAITFNSGFNLTLNAQEDIILNANISAGTGSLYLNIGLNNTAGSLILADGVSASGAVGTSTITGGAGTNTIDYSAYNSNVTIQIDTSGTNTITNLPRNLVNIQNIKGGLAENTFTILNGDMGTFTGNGTQTSFSLFNASTLNTAIGTNSALSYIYLRNTSSLGTFTGGAGYTSVTLYDAGTAITTITTLGQTVLNMNAAGTIGSVDAQTGYVTAYAKYGTITSLTGGSGGTNTLYGPAGGATWNVDGAYTGHVPGVVTDFTNIQYLYGSYLGAGNNTYNMIAGHMGTIYMGNGSNVLTLTSGTIDTVTGAGSDRIEGPTDGATWNITAANAGNMTGTVAGEITNFSGIGTLKGGATGADHFNLPASPTSSSVTIDGNSASGNTLDYSNYGAFNSVTVNVTGANAGTSSGSVTFSNIQNIIPSAYGINYTVGGTWDTLSLGNGTNSCIITGTVTALNGDAGYNTITINGGGGVTTLTGSTNYDNISVTGSVTTLNVNSSSSIVTMNAGCSITNLNGNVGAHNYYYNGGTISTLTGSGTDTLYGPTSGTHSWYVTGAPNSGRINNVGNPNRIIAFSGVNTFRGRAATNYFYIYDDLNAIYMGTNTNIIVMQQASNLSSVTSTGGHAYVYFEAPDYGVISNFYGGGDDTIYSRVVGTSTFTITGNGAGSLTTYLPSFTGVSTIAGGWDADKNSIFNINSGGTILYIEGSYADNKFYFNGGRVTGYIAGNGITNELYFADNQGFSADYTGSGTSSMDFSAYTLNHPINITLTTSNGRGTSNKTGNFTGINSIIGGAGNNTFTFLSGGGVSGTIDGGVGGTNTLDYSALNTPVTVDLETGTATSTGGISNFHYIKAGKNANTLTGSNSHSNTYEFTADPTVASTVTGGTGNTDTLSFTTSTSNNTWYIYADTTGSVGNITTFSNIANLVGGTGNDHFIFSDGAVLNGRIYGGTVGTKTLDLGLYSTPVVMTVGDVNRGTSTGVTGGYEGINALIGGFGNGTFSVNPGGSIASITGGNGSNTFQLLGGNVTTGITGGSGVDNFVFADGAGITGTINGGAGGTNTLNFSAYTAGNPLTFNVTGDNTGTTSKTGNFSEINVITGGNGGNTFTIGGNMTTINMGGGTNTLTLNTGTITTVNGNAGNNTYTINGGTIDNLSGSTTSSVLIGPNGGASWDITGNNAGSLTGTVVGSVGFFTNVQNVTGRNGNDTFYFYDGANLAGNLNGGAGTNTLNYLNYHLPVTINIPGNTATCVGGTISNVQSGSALDGDLIGGDENDTFYIYYNGTVDGRGGTNTLVSMNNNNTWTITGANAGTIETVPPPVGLVTFNNIQNLVGGGQDDTFILPAHGLVQSITGDGGNNTIVSPNAPTTWTIDGSNSGNFHGSGTTIFNSIQNITAGNDNDTFYFLPGGQVTGTLDGGAGTNVIDFSNYGSSFRLVYTGATSGSIIGPYGVVVQNFTNIQQIILPTFMIQQADVQAIVATTSQVTQELSDYYSSLKETSSLLTSPKQPTKVIYNAVYDPARSKDGSMFKMEPKNSALPKKTDIYRETNKRR
jgi:filamentous hemagglutinin family protein